MSNQAGHHFWIKYATTVRCVIVAGFLAFVASVGHADTLAPGQTLAPPPLEYLPSPGATVLFSTNTAFQSTDFAGILISTILTNDASNPYGGLTFTYQIQLNLNTIDPVSRMSISSYGNFLTDVGFTNAPLNLADTPSAISRSGNGNVIRINFDTGGGLPAGEESALIVIQTDSQNWQFTTAAFVDGASANAISLAPASIVPIPEPSAAMLGTLGLIGLAFGRRWKIP